LGAEARKEHHIGIKFYTNVLLFVSTAIIASSLFWDFYKLNKVFVELARSEARASINKDIVYRKWNASHGAVYTKMTKDSPPNPYLAHIPERDIETGTGNNFTMVNPAYMTRQVYELEERELGIKNRLTSLRPLRPENAADAWEREALLSFERGSKESSTVIDSNNGAFLRLMHPLYVEEECMRCHAQQGYKIGDVRGGISVSVDMKGYYAAAKKLKFMTGAGHIAAWLLCISVIHLGGKKLRSKADELKRAHSFSEKIFNGVNEPVAVIDAHTFELIKVNSAFSGRYTRENEKAIGRRCYEVLKDRSSHCADSGLPCPILKTLESKNHVTEEHSCYTSDCREIYTEVSTYPVYDEEGTIDSVIHISKDITARKLFEESLQTAREKADAANRAKSDLISMISHDVRNPMNGIIGMIDLAIDTDPSPAQKKYLELIKQSSHSLMSILNDVLDLSKIESGKLELEHMAFSPQEVIANSVGMFEYLAEKKGLSLKYNISTDVPQVLKGDPTRLKQVLANLLGNALKFTDRGSVELSVMCQKNEGDYVILCFSVKDTGIGIPDNIKSRIFESFTQADKSTARKYGGSGLGLAISQKLVKLMNGQLWVDSALGEGSIFHFTAKFENENGV